tara:strand:+ start:82 stop:1476 length:1395 start_codon:yes stop_codon:yes gene_type:complete
MLNHKFKKDLIKLKQYYSFKFVVASNELNAIKSARGIDPMFLAASNQQLSYDVIFLANCLGGSGYGDSEAIYFVKLKNNELKKVFLKKQINFQFIYDDEELLEASESFYDFLFLASKQQKSDPNFYSKALKICPICILDYADHLPKDLDPEIIEDVITRFPFLYSFINSKFTIPKKVTNEFIKKKLYFCDAKLLKDKLEQANSAVSVEQDLENFRDNEVLSSLFRISYGIGLDGSLIDELGVAISEKNLYLFDFNKEKSICYSASFCPPASFLIDLFASDRSSERHPYVGEIGLNAEKYEELIDLIRESNRPIVEKHEMNVYLIMHILLGIFDNYLEELLYSCWRDTPPPTKQNLFSYCEWSEAYLASLKIRQLFFSYQSLTKDFRKDYNKDINPFVLVATKRQSDRHLRHIYQKQRRNFTREINLFLEQSCLSINNKRLYRRYLENFQSVFYCKRLYGKTRNS